MNIYQVEEQDYCGGVSRSFTYFIYLNNAKDFISAQKYPELYRINVVKTQDTID